MTDHVQPAPAITAPNWRPYVALGFGVLAVSTAAIFIRLGQEGGAPSLVLAAARLVVATLVLTPIVLRQHQEALRQLTPSDLALALASGVVLSMHFAAWISSLEYTAVVNSVVIVTTNPLWVALLAPFLLGEKLGRWALVGLALAFSGGVLVSLSGEVGEPPTRSDPWLGNGLALLGAIMAAIYFIIGRRLRARLNVIVYAWVVYGAASIILSLVVLVSGLQVGGFSAETYLWMIMMGLFPQLIGHSSFNFALGYLPAAYVSLVVLLEPVGSGLLAIPLLGEWPVPLQLAGASIILVGIAVATRDQRAEEALGEPELGDPALGENPPPG